MGAYDLSFEAVSSRLAALGQPAYRARQVWDGLYRNGVLPRDLTVLPAALRSTLRGGDGDGSGEDWGPSLHMAHESVSDGGGTVKWLWRLHDDRYVETVLLHHPRWSTVCVSSQAGCAMACSFCATGQAGFDRHLTTGEIVEQVVHARRVASAAGRRLSNVVFMGMGEPLANYEPVWGAVERLHEDVGLSARHVTVSTVGVVPGIRRLATEALPVNLAVSLHAANDELRDSLVPLNRRYPLDALAGACREYLEAKGRRLSFEWALIDGVNDRASDADELAAFVRPLGGHVNLIPLNPTPGYPTRGTPPERVRAFRDRLHLLGVNATVRRNRGTDIDAACGQLRASVVALGARRALAD
jgi:23S rRNA (adenine2503-C2)-methyltransferase